MEIQSVVQGEYAVTTSKTTSMTTVLGSCISACIYDPEAEVGGMNHFLLPEPVAGHPSSAKYGAFLMELLVNELLKLGAQKRRMRAKLYGGSHMNAAMANVGARNIDFVNRYLRNEDIVVVDESLGGTQSRRVTFQPTTGKVELKLGLDTTVEEESVPRLRRSKLSEIELF